MSYVGKFHVITCNWLIIINLPDTRFAHAAIYRDEAYNLNPFVDSMSVTNIHCVATRVEGKVDSYQQLERFLIHVEQFSVQLQ